MAKWKVRLRLADWLEKCAWRIRDAVEREEYRKRQKTSKLKVCDEGFLTFVFVQFREGETAYCYLAETDIFQIGDRVNVPVGNYGHMLHGTVVDVQHLPPEEAPYPLDAIKTVAAIIHDDEE